MQAVVFPAPETVIVEQVPDPACERDEVIVQGDYLQVNTPEPLTTQE